MKYRGINERDLVVFANKLLQDMKSSFSVDAIASVEQKDQIEFSGKKGRLIAEVSDFGMGDIGFKSLEINTGDKSLKFVAEDRPALSARILPSIADFKEYVAETKGAGHVSRVLSMVQGLGNIKLTDEPQVLRDGIATGLKEFEVSRQRNGVSIPSVGYGS